MLLIIFFHASFYTPMMLKKMMLVECFNSIDIIIRNFERVVDIIGIYNVKRPLNFFKGPKKGGLSSIES